MFEHIIVLVLLTLVIGLIAQHFVTKKQVEDSLKTDLAWIKLEIQKLRGKAP